MMGCCCCNGCGVEKEDGEDEDEPNKSPSKFTSGFLAAEEVLDDVLNEPPPREGKLDAGEN